MSNGIVTIQCLGNYGRWGNALFQYCWARAYAESIGAELRIPNWEGRHYFEGVNENLINGLELPRFEGEHPTGETNIDLRGYFQTTEHVAFLSRKKVKEWLKPTLEYQMPSKELVFHKRRGDYISYGCYGVVKDESYDAAARQFGYNPSDAVVYDDSRPVSSTHSDFFEILAAKRIFRANSTYSWWAATLSDAKVYSPVVEDRSGWIDCEFVEGNHPRLMYLFGNLQIGE